MKHSRLPPISSCEFLAKLIKLMDRGFTHREAWKQLLATYSLARDRPLPPCLTRLAKKCKLKP